MRKILFVGSMLLVASPANARERPAFYRHMVTAGLGNHLGWAGVNYTYRFKDWISAYGGFGAIGAAVGARTHPISEARGIYFQGGVSPLFTSEDLGTFYGPDLGIGYELQRTRFGFFAGLGYGIAHVLFVNESTVSFDIGLGVNLGRAN